jgi:hypothetical protein
MAVPDNTRLVNEMGGTNTLGNGLKPSPLSHGINDSSFFGDEIRNLKP